MMKKIRDWFRGDTLEIISWDKKSQRWDWFPGRLRIDPMFAWYDFWIGIFVDTEKRRIYVFPVPMFGIKIWWGP